MLTEQNALPWIIYKFSNEDTALCASKAPPMRQHVPFFFNADLQSIKNNVSEFVTFIIKAMNKSYLLITLFFFF